METVQSPSAAKRPDRQVANPLSRRMRRWALLVSAALIIALAVGRAWWDYQSSIHTLQDEFDIIAATSVQPISASVWDYDTRQLVLQVEGIKRFRYVRYVGVHDSSGAELATAGEFVNGPVLDREFSLFVLHDGKQRLIGVLQVQADLHQVARDAIMDGLLALAFNTALVLTVVTLLTWLTNRMLSRHLEALARHLQDFDLHGEAKPLVLQRKNEQDELGLLVTTVNEMQSGLLASYQRLMSLQQELQQAKELAELTSRAKSQFLSNMSHEIRTPLNGMMVMLQLIRQGELTRELEGYADMALRSGRRLGTLLGDILDLSRIEAGKFELFNKPFHLSDLVQSLMDTHSMQAGGDAAGFSAKVQEGLPTVLVGDELRVRQILSNLVGNAMKFGQGREVRLEISTLPTAQENMARLLFTVSDTGVGIADDKLGEIFQPFFQVSSDLAKSHQGAGLGLAIVRHLVNALGGDLCYDSSLGQGTTAYLILSFAVADAAATLAHPSNAPSTDMPPLRILLVDDEEINRIGTRQSLSKWGHKVVAVTSGQDALSALRSGSFDVVLMDIQMEGMDGIEATRRIRAGECGDCNVNVPIIALTAYAMAGDRERFLAAGMDNYVSKPVNPEQLQAVLRR